MKEIKTVGVVGAGQMGAGIAQVIATSGFNTVLFDAAPQALEKGIAGIEARLAKALEKGTLEAGQREATLKRLAKGTSIKDLAGCDLVIEAVIEQFEAKAALFREIDKVLPAPSLLVSNTSSISITRLAAVTSRPNNVMGVHFMNPVPVMKLVEVIRGYSTSDEVCAQVMAWSQALGKEPVEVNDYPGFVANRILMPMINEAIITLNEGVADVAAIDAVMRMGMAHPMGPLQLADFIGLDVCLSILRVLHDGLGQAKYAPCPLLVNMVTAGKLGAKSGEGFYLHTPGSKELKVSPRFA